MASGEPFVSADSEHLNARLVDNVVTGSGEVRYRPVHVRRTYRFNDANVTCEVQLSDTIYRAGYQGRGEPSVLTELYEMIPYIAGKKEKPTTVTAYDAAGKPIGPVTKTPQPASAAVFDRGGFGAQVVFENPYPVLLGVKDTLLVQLADKRVSAKDVRLTYTLVPYIGEPVIGRGAVIQEEHPLAKLDAIASLDIVPERLAAVEPMTVKADGRQVAQLRFAITGEDLAVDADVIDARVTQTDPPWKGSSLEIFASAPGSEAIAQVFLLPAARDKPAVGLRAARPRPQRVAGIRVKTALKQGGYRLQALIPLSELSIGKEQRQVKIEFQVGAVANRKLGFTTLFGSRFAYENNTRYGLFAIGGEAQKPGE